MKLQNSYVKSNITYHALPKNKHDATGRNNFYDNINTRKNINYRPAKAISFGGSAASIGDKFLRNHALNKLIAFVNENEAAYNAIYSLLIAGIVKPIVVMKTSGSDEKDKQIIATKNFLQAFVGSFLSLTVGGGLIKKIFDVMKTNLNLIDIDNETGKIKTILPDSERAFDMASSALIKENTGFGARIKNAKNAFSQEGILKSIKAFFKKPAYFPSSQEVKDKATSMISDFTRNHKSIFDKNTQFVASLKANEAQKDAFESFWKNSTGWVTSIGKAKVASLLLPTVMAVLFAKRNLEKKKEEENKLITLNSSNTFKKEQENYKAMMNISSGTKPSFTGKILDGAIENLSKGVEELAMTKAGEGAVKTLAKLPKPLNKPSARMADLESFMLTGYWVLNTSKSKKIEPSQKLGLNVHTVLVTAVSSISAFLLDTLFDGLIKKAQNAYKNDLSDIVEAVKSQAANVPEAMELLKEKCSGLYGVDNILKQFAHTEINSANAAKTVEKLAGDYGKKLGKFKSLTIFTLVVRFLVPVLMVKPSAKLKKKIQKYKEEKIKNKQLQTKTA